MISLLCETKLSLTSDCPGFSYYPASPKWCPLIPSETFPLPNHPLLTPFRDDFGALWNRRFTQRHRFKTKLSLLVFLTTQGSVRISKSTIVRPHRCQITLIDNRSWWFHRLVKPNFHWPILFRLTPMRYQSGALWYLPKLFLYPTIPYWLPSVMISLLCETECSPSEPGSKPNFHSPMTLWVFLTTKMVLYDTFRNSTSPILSPTGTRRIPNFYRLKLIGS